MSTMHICMGQSCVLIIIMCVYHNNVCVMTIDIISVVILELHAHTHTRTHAHTHTRTHAHTHTERELTADSKMLFRPLWGSSVQCTQIHEYYILLCTDIKKEAYSFIVQHGIRVVVPSTSLTTIAQ